MRMLSRVLSANNVGMLQMPFLILAKMSDIYLSLRVAMKNVNLDFISTRNAREFTNKLNYATTK